MDNKDYGFGGWGIVILIALFFLLFAGRGFGGSGESSPATQADVQRATDFAALERQNNEGEATRTLLQQQENQRLRDELAQSRAANNDYMQSQYILGQLGRYYQNPPCNPCSCGG